MNLNKKTSLAILLLFSALLMTTFAVASVRAAYFYSDTFDDATEDGWSSRWNLKYFDAGTTGNVAVDTTNHMLLVTLTDATHGLYGIALDLKDTEIPLTGDFSLQVDYTLINWVAHPILRIGLGHVASDGSHWMWNTLASESAEVFVDADGGETNVSPHPTSSETAGTMRVVRRDSTVTAYFKDATHDWTEVGHTTQGTGDLLVQLGFWGGEGPISGQNFQVAFDNLYVWEGDIFVVPEYEFGALLAVVACFAAFAVIKKPKLRFTLK